ncbi:hypothetical protein FVE85_1320 [Porphyridium purpureum]|uniref:Large ribosomal subunit protein mL53 n=1 Tax=Porphyridium purpureum TaxID=35688 RepID=A0A5J4YJS3_PORPP|nr:hypothetical protein FVE85_1320 [Porphyridium purpureum]|eukprot:POR0556..scf251_18
MGRLRKSLMLAERNCDIFAVLGKIEVSFNPFNNCSATARELLKQFQTRPVLEKNPKLEVKVMVGPTYVPSRVHIEYQDGSKQTIFPDHRMSREVIDEIRTMAHSKQLGALNPFAVSKP